MPATQPYKSPMTADEVFQFIEQLNLECKSKAARKRMAEIAITHGNITTEGKQLWRDYLEGGAWK